ncbi:hypothetical protein [Streptomyces sp. SID5643]|uniref:hypothetical protein n=1 Tax=Streptomyces sp. SID5643 TaxID=2690307 RepID=UPI001368963B|nr:hypothetical protein [Streptomyces sp. SID5643]MZF86462.1 hypothetical protein [Streptomyces sp. SID5643]
MGSETTGGAVVTGRANRLVTTGCLTLLIVLITVLGIPVSWLWYRHWHDGNVNSERRERARAAIEKQARARAGATDRALDASGTTDVDALTGVVWQHSKAPVITYDASRREFTATAASAAHYDAKAILPGGGSGRVTGCFVFTFTRHPGQGWTSQVSERDDATCRPSTQIGHRVRLALTRISGMDADDLTPDGIQNALDPTQRRSFDVNKVVPEGDTTTVFVLVSSSHAGTCQCYRFTRPVPDGAGRGPATAVPASSC